MDCHQRDLAVVIDEADARQAFVRDALIQLHRMEVAEVHAALGELFVEPDHERLIFRTNRPDRYRHAPFYLPDAGVLRRIGADGRPGEPIFGQIRRVQRYAGVQRQQVLARGQQWVDFDLANPGQFHHQPAEAH